MTLTTLATPTREQVLDQLVDATLVDAIAYAIAAPQQLVDRLTHGRFPETLTRWQARAVEHVIKHRSTALAATALTS